MSDEKTKKPSADEAAEKARAAELKRQREQADAVREAGLSEADGGTIPQSVSFLEPGLGK